MARIAQALLLAGFVISGSVSLSAAESPGGTDPKDLVRQVFLTWSDHDVSRLDTLFGDEGVYEDVPPKIVYRGKDEIKKFMSAIWSWAPDITFTPTSIDQLGDTVVAEWTMQGTQTGPIGGIPASGNSFSVRGVSVVKVDQGRILRHSDYYDLSTILVQFGVRYAAPPPKEAER